MFGLTILDLALILMLLSYLIYGLRNGFMVTLGGIAGFVVGAVAAFMAVPLVSGWVTDSGWRLTATVGAAVVLIALGHGLGTMIGRKVRHAVRIKPLHAVDRLIGGAVSVVVAALVMSMLAFSISSLGVPFVSQQLAESRVIRYIDNLTPTPVKSTMAQLRSTVIGDGIPKLIEGIGPVTPVPVPNESTDTPALNQAAESVLKIAGTAFECGQNQTGSGFVVSPGRVVTNAHVVAGVSQPVVEVPDGGALPGRVVYFDSQRDIAVLAVDGLRSSPLPLSADLAEGSPAAFAGYPHGGPFQSKPATIQGISTILVPDIYGNNPSPAQVYRLAGDVQPGNSGGPLLTMQGQVAGLIFAKTTTDAALGFALTMEDLEPVAAQAPGLSSPVSAGQCTRK
ncbi:MarP family serine protease [Paenarthrobacter aurescens]|uniref:MarP family serine protease n=1 Tax=Paenarthrobacter aurescens TaxID=43663 RepID=UPI00114376B9|nr:MarP family serine protease [Paenarthrobacter aurescens]UKA49125.1 MarP family serine protease [Arthrobacter sp. FW305-123]MDO6144746.1 MarP family serine protease [Paenarthrobacter aurescens]MDO6148590.1 MarP family serine protease [Paenarthrobacter aurescens]MDO6159837.1 MarP family serine protease [Paenarthrobacter aurescens]MDO6163700.1 MarP family serine protease [Paenarthrobacter aurescens]